MKHHSNRLQNVFISLLSILAATSFGFLSGCSSPPSARPAPAPSPQPPTAKAPSAQWPAREVPAPGKASFARNSKEYRKDAAAHLYSLHATRIYAGRMPPLLEAVGVLNIDIDQKGAVRSIDWMRAPKHVPQVMAEIERMVRAAAPYPVPRNMGRVTYTDTWLWHQSGKFQLDTLTEGQD
jgi:protein TonB